MTDVVIDTDVASLQKDRAPFWVPRAIGALGLG